MQKQIVSCLLAAFLALGLGQDAVLAGQAAAGIAVEAEEPAGESAPEGTALTGEPATEETAPAGEPAPEGMVTTSTEEPAPEGTETDFSGIMPTGLGRMIQIDLAPEEDRKSVV